MKTRLFNCLLLTFILTSSCFGEDFFASNEDQLRNSLNSASPGDRIRLASGVWSLKDSLNVFRSGTASAPITLISRGNTIFDGSLISGGNPAPLKFNGAEHWVIENLTCRNSNGAGISINDSRFLEFANVECHTNNGSGFDTYRSPDLKFFFCVAHGNFDLATNGQNSDGFAIKIDSNRCQLFACDAYENSDDGYDFWRSTDCLIDDCWAFLNGLGDGDGNGFKMGSPIGESGDHQFQYCIAWDNRVVGFDNNGASLPNRVFHCVACRNASGFVGFTQDMRISNCIEFQNPQGNFLGNGVDNSFNTWNLGIDNPLFFQTSDPSSPNFFSLRPRSACIDAGINVGLPFKGKSPDLGVRERR